MATIPMAEGGLEARVVRYRDLKPCYNAFVDTRSPGSEAKENFTIIGPGVSENPAQHVHIEEPHGFNIGGARQPPGCVNSQHSHDTPEVFVVHSGSWRFDLGENGEDAQVECHPGDVISLPTKMFRGFTNVGEDVGFLWAVLGGDDPGRVLWAPKVFDLAAAHGLVLLENGSLVDTVAGESVPTGVRPMPRTTPEQMEALTRGTPDQAERLVVRARSVTEPLIGPGAPLDVPHGFTLERLRIEDRVELTGKVVLFVQDGTIVIASPDDAVRLGPGDTITLPLSADPYSVTGEATVFAVRSTL